MNILGKKTSTNGDAPRLTEYAPPTRRKLSELAANTAQDVLDLEAENKENYSASQEWERRYTLTAGELGQSRSALDTMTLKMEHYQAACTRAEAQLEIAGKIVLDALDALKGRRAYEPGAVLEVAVETPYDQKGDGA